MGFSEDIGKEIKPSLRIAAGFASGFVAVFLTDYWITSIEVPYFDLLLTIPVIAIPLSAFASTTIAHSFNLIDGLNGLCSGLSILAFLFFGALAFICDDAEILSTMALAVLRAWLLADQRDNGKNLPRRRGRLFSWTYGSLDGYCPRLKISDYFTMGALFLGLIYPISETLITIGRGD